MNYKKKNHFKAPAMKDYESVVESKQKREKVKV